MWGDSEYGIPDPEYGVSFEPTTTRRWTDEDFKRAAQIAKERERERKTSADFNSYIIQLFNDAQKRS